MVPKIASASTISFMSCSRSAGTILTWDETLWNSRIASGGMPVTKILNGWAEASSALAAANKVSLFMGDLLRLELYQRWALAVTMGMGNGAVLPFPVMLCNLGICRYAYTIAGLSMVRHAR